MSVPGKIPILDITPEVDELWPELSERLERVIRSGQFILGPETKNFESEIATFLGVKHAIGVNSGTDALVIGLRAAGIGEGHEVITTPFTFFATAESISNVGATPVFVDVDLATMNMNCDAIEAAITDQTKAIMPVHLFGNPCQMNKIMALAAKHDLRVIEDCAQSFGATYSAPCQGCDRSCSLSVTPGKQTGTIGHVGAYSFFPTKNLGCYGDGGLITTDDDTIAEECRKLRAHGSIKKYHNEVLGYNSRLDSIQAAILSLKLPRVTGYNDARRAIATRYRDMLAGVSGVITPEVAPGHVFHQYTIRLTDAPRDEVQKRMADLGVSTMVYYPVPQHRLPVYAGQYGVFENAEILAAQVLSLPIWPQMSAEIQLKVVEVLKESL